MPDARRNITPIAQWARRPSELKLGNSLSDSRETLVLFNKYDILNIYTCTDEGICHDISI